MKAKIMGLSRVNRVSSRDCRKQHRKHDLVGSRVRPLRGLTPGTPEIRGLGCHLEKKTA